MEVSLIASTLSQKLRLLGKGTSQWPCMNIGVTRPRSLERIVDSRPVLGISAGDPGGIGPEITAKALY